MLGVLLAAEAQGCIALPGMAGSAPVIFEGRLSLRIFPGPPNYEDVRLGDRPQRTYILTLPRPICLDDGGDFADPNQRFTRVQLNAGEDAMVPRLRAGLGHRVRVSGSGFAAHNGHHNAPLVVRVHELRTIGR